MDSTMFSKTSVKSNLDGAEGPMLASAKISDDELNTMVLSDLLLLVSTNVEISSR